MMMFYN